MLNSLGTLSYKIEHIPDINIINVDMNAFNYGNGANNIQKTATQSQNTSQHYTGVTQDMKLEEIVPNVHGVNTNSAKRQGLSSIFNVVRGSDKSKANERLQHTEGAVSNVASVNCLSGNNISEHQAHHGNIKGITKSMSILNITSKRKQRNVTKGKRVFPKHLRLRLLREEYRLRKYLILQKRYKKTNIGIKIKKNPRVKIGCLNQWKTILLSHAHKTMVGRSKEHDSDYNLRKDNFVLTKAYVTHQPGILEQENIIKQLTETVDELHEKLAIEKSKLETNLKNTWIKNEDPAILQMNKYELITKVQELTIKNDELRESKLVTISAKNEIICTLQQNIEETSKLLEKQTNSLQAIIKEKDRTIQEYSVRLAKEMSNKVASDEGSLENVSIQNRPMNIAAEYHNLCTNQWHDAINELDSWHCIGEHDRKRLLCDVFIISAERCTSIYNSNMNKLKQLLSNPMNENNNHRDLRESDFPDNIKVMFGDFLRMNADKVTSESQVEIIKAELTKDNGNITSSLDNPIVDKYIKDCLCLTWKMVLQRPPMKFQMEGINEAWQGDKRQEVFWNSSDPKHPDSKVKYYVHPALFHGDNLMVKGTVFLYAT